MRVGGVRFIARLGETLELFWPLGCALLQVRLAARWIKLEGEAYESAQYLLLGTLYPATLLAISLADRLGIAQAGVLRTIKLALAVFGLWVCGSFGFRELTLPIMAIAVAHWALIGLLGAVRLRARGGVALLTVRWWPRAEPAPAGSWTVLDALAGLFLVVLSWSLAVRMLWWSSFAFWVIGSPYTFGTFLAALILIAANFTRKPPLPLPVRPRSWASTIGSLLALLILALASFRADSLGGTAEGHPFQLRGMVAFHHWGAIVVPADLVRHGGWLLWDVPSQYGFLSTLTLAALPLKSVWQSFYVLNSVLLFLSACFLFAICRSLRTGRTNLVFSLAVAWAAVFMVPGWPIPEQPTGPYVTPAVGAYRFLWCYALLAILVWEYRTPHERGTHWKPLALGSLTWLLGSLWSCESATYCAAIWLPAYVAMLWRRALDIEPSGSWWNSRRVRFLVPWLSLPSVLLLAAWGAITAFYIARLGHGPDWQAFVDHARATRFFALPVEPRGIVLVQLLVLAALSTLAVACVGTRQRLGALALIGGAWGAFWATCSYFVGRSHEVNALNLSPLLCAGMVVGLHVLQHEHKHSLDQPHRRLAPLIKMALAPVFVVLLTITFGNEARLPGTLAAMRRGYLHKIDNSLPRMDERLDRLFHAARVRTIDAIATNEDSPLPARIIGDGRTHRRRVFAHTTWGPPMILIAPLPEERRAVYFQRFARRAGTGAWLVEKKDRAERMGWYRDLFLESLHATESFEDPQWRLTHFEANGLRR